MIKRDNYNVIAQSLEKKEISILIGARQVGKTTILKEIKKNLMDSGKKVLYLNLDIEDDAKYFSSQQMLLSRIQLEFGDKSCFVFIDEIQQKEDAGRFLKGIYDMDLPYKFFVTGSGSLELKEKIGEALTGRKHLVMMDPVNFREFVNYKTNNKYKKRLNQYFALEAEKTWSMLNQYLVFGGYPKIVTLDSVQEKVEVMNEIFTSYITKDISYLMGVRSTDKFIKMIKLLAAQSGGILNHAQLASDTGISVDTLNNYLWYAEQTFIVSLVKPFFSNAKKEITKSPVVYFNDIGMLRFACNKFGQLESGGFIFQSFIFNLLKQKYSSSLNPINHWRSKDKAEVDFVIHVSGNVVPVEVKYSDLKKSTISRSFRSFIHRYQPLKAMIVNLSYKHTLIVENTEVEFIPFWELVI